MSKVNPWFLPRPELPEDTVTLTDPAQPGVELTLHLRALSVPDASLIDDRATEMTARFAKGGFIPPNGGGPVRVSVPARSPPTRRSARSCGQCAPSGRRPRRWTRCSG